MKTVDRLFEAPLGSFMLLGPRGTGKSQWTRMRFPEALFIDLLDPRLYRELLAHPEHLRELIAGHPEVRTVVVDEVQKIPELLSVVHAIIEDRREIRFVLTGSSARKLRRGGVDLLAGRAVATTLHPFVAAEMGDAFVLDTALMQGMIPLVAGAADPEATLRSYLDLYIREEVYQEGLVRSVGNFARFLEAVSFSQGSVLNTSAVSRECGVERKSVDAYLQILEDLLIAFRLPVFATRAQRAVVQHPKFYFFDVGVYRSIRPAGPLDNVGLIPGVALETLVAQHLRAWCALSAGDCRLHYWRTHAGLEVDFIIYGRDVFTAIEVKSTARIRPEDLKGIKAFLSEYPEARGMVLYRGSDRMKVGDVLCVPCEDFLRGLVPGTNMAPGN